MTDFGFGLSVSGDSSCARAGEQKNNASRMPSKIPRPRKTSTSESAEMRVEHFGQTTMRAGSFIAAQQVGMVVPKIHYVNQCIDVSRCRSYSDSHAKDC